LFVVVVVVVVVVVRLSNVSYVIYVGEAMRLYLDTVQKLPHFGAAVFKGFLHADCKFTDWDFEAGELSASRSAVNKIEHDLEWSIGISERGDAVVYIFI